MIQFNCLLITPYAILRVHRISSVELSVGDSSTHQIGSGGVLSIPDRHSCHGTL